MASGLAPGVVRVFSSPEDSLVRVLSNSESATRLSVVEVVAGEQPPRRRQSPAP
jgi:hypothetical protein